MDGEGLRGMGRRAGEEGCRPQGSSINVDEALSGAVVGWEGRNIPRALLAGRRLEGGMQGTRGSRQATQEMPCSKDSLRPGLISGTAPGICLANTTEYSHGTDGAERMRSARLGRSQTRILRNNWGRLHSCSV